MTETASRRPVRAALIGYGYWGSNLARNLAQNPRADLAWICDTSAERRDNAVARFAGIQVAADPLPALADDGVDVVLVATPADQHFEQASLALSHGKDVFVEKPLALTYDQARDLVQQAKDRQAVLMVGHTFLYNNLVHEVRRRIDEGELGDLLYVYSERLNLGIFREDTDVVWTLAPHDISITNYWFGDRPVAVSARGDVHIHKSRDLAELAFVKLDYADGRSAHFHLSWLSPRKRRMATVVGTRAMLVYDDMNPEQHITIYDKGVRVKTADGGSQEISEVADLAEHQTYVRSGDVTIPNVRMSEPLAKEIDHLVDCVATRARPRSDGESGADVVAILEAIERSMTSSGALVPIAYRHATSAEAAA